MPEQSREEIIAALKGQTVRVPDLEALFAGWQVRTNPDQYAVTSVVDHILEHHSMTKAVETKLKRANLALLVASWYPTASPETLQQITYFVCWMYVVDDAIIDKVSWPGLDNAAAFDEASRQLDEFVRAHLRLDNNTETVLPVSDIEAINSFAGIGKALCYRYSLSQRLAFYQAYTMTMAGYRTEQQLRVAGRLPTWKEYWMYREGSSCIRMCVAMIELAIGSTISGSVMHSKEMQDLWTETTVLTWLTNDLISAKKELGEDFIENAVALGSVDTLIAQDGISFTIRLIKDSMARFEERIVAIERKYLNSDKDELTRPGDSTPNSGSISLKLPIKDFIESCRSLVRGSISWSVISPRYGLSSLARDGEGWLVFVVGD